MNPEDAITHVVLQAAKPTITTMCHSLLVSKQGSWAFDSGWGACWNYWMDEIHLAPSDFFLSFSFLDPCLEFTGMRQNRLHKTQHPVTQASPQTRTRNRVQLSFVRSSRHVSFAPRGSRSCLVTPITCCKHLFRPPRMVRACFHDL